MENQTHTSNSPIPNPSTLTPPSIQDIQSPQSKKRRGLKITIITILVALLILISTLAILFFNSSEKTQEITSESPLAGISPHSKVQGFPIVNQKNGAIYIYNLQTDEITQQPIDGIRKSGYSGSSGIGDTEIHISPDLTQSAVIDTNTHDLFIISHETSQAQRVTNHGEVGYITGWTKNGKHLIYYRLNSQAFIDENDPNNGFYIWNRESGETAKLENITYIEALADEKILIKESNQYTLFDINTKKMDNSQFLSNYENNNFFNQIDLNRDATQWTFTISVPQGSGSGTGAEIQYTEIGKRDGQLIVSGSFASVQFPRLSPSSKRMTYMQNMNTTVAYDIEKQSIIGSAPGRTVQWIDDNTLLLVQIRENEQFYEYSIWDIDNNEINNDIHEKLSQSAYEEVDTSSFPDEYQKRRFDVQKNFEEYITIPETLQKEYESNLVGITCNTFTNYEGTGWEYTARYSDGSEHSKHKLSDIDIITLIENTSNLSQFEDDEKKVASSALVCKLEDGRLYIERATEELAFSAPHAFLYTNETLSHIAKIAYSGDPLYSGCTILQITKNSEFYYRCGTGDGGYAATEFQKVVPGNNAQVLFKCEFSMGSSAECYQGSTKPSTQ